VPKQTAPNAAKSVPYWPSADDFKAQAVDAGPYLAELRAMFSLVGDARDGNGLGISRRLRGCGCDRCVAHFAALREPGDE
jgi:hypothetical protein